MKYDIPLKKILNYVNPIEDNFLNLAEIEMLFLKGKIDPEEHDSTQVILMKKIAYKIANFEEGYYVRLNIGGIEKGEPLLEAGLIDLCAAQYLKRSPLSVEIIAEEKTVKKMFGKVEFSEHQSAPTTEDTMPFVWNIDAAVFASTWGDKDFVLKQIAHHGGDILSLIPNHVLKEPEVIHSLFQKENLFNLLSEDFLNSDEVFEQAKTDYMVFGYLWKHNYEKNYKTQPKWTEKIDKHIFNNKEMAKSLLGYKYQIGLLYSYFSLELKLDKDIVNALHRTLSGTGIDQYLPAEYFAQPENVIQYLTQYRDKQSNYISEKVSAYWRDNKEKVLEYSYNYNAGSVYRHLSPEFKKDKDIAKAVLHSNINVYSDFPDELQEDLEIIKVYLKQGGHTHKISHEILYQITDKEIIKRALQNNSYLIKNSPQSWRTDLDILSALYHDLEYKWQNLDKPLQKFLLSTKESVKSMVSSNALIYNVLPLKWRAEPEIALKIISSGMSLKSERDYHSVLKQIPARLWINRHFALQAVTLNEKLAEKIPASFFRNKEFILQLAREIDKENIDSSVFNFTPLEVRKEVKYFIDSFAIEDNFEKFFSTYFFKETIETTLPEKTTNTKRVKI